MSLSFALVGGALAAAGDSVADAGKKLEGEWVVEKAVVNGEESKVLVGATYGFKGGKLTMQPANKDLPAATASYEVLAPEPQGKLMRVSIRRNGADGKPEVGRPLDGVFRVEGEKLDLCHCVAPADLKLTHPPSELESKVGSGHMFIVLKKK
jgi:uncharacterized protein (TIGR03067 family)